MEAQRYFQSYRDYFWEWERTSEGQFLTIPNSKTIAHHNHVIEILDYLSEESIPPFGSLLLALIATNSSSGESFDGLLYYVQDKQKEVDGKMVPDLEAAISFLEKLRRLTDYRDGNKKLLLLKTIFSDCHKRISSEKAKIIVEDYKNTSISLAYQNFNYNNFIKDFKVLELLNKKFSTSKSIIDAMQGLPVNEVEEILEEEILEQESAGEKKEDFIESLIEDENTFHVGSLIKRIWSGLNIPLHHNMPSSQPLGGISDLTNKGDFDKLLISEFAQDDLVFMSRVANNEALYIQREVPPEADNFERIILVDTTLKNWGNPKILNFATALAIAKHPKTDIDCKLFSVGNSYEEVHYKTIDEVINGLNILSPKLDCAQGIANYMADRGNVSKSQELFLITSEDSLKMTAMQKVMSDYFDAFKYIITTNHHGKIVIYKNQNKGKKCLQTMILPLDTLWEKKLVKKKVKDERRIEIDDTVFNFPLYYGQPQNPIAKFFLDGKFYFLTSSKSLQKTYVANNQKYYENYRGCETLFENISIKSGGIYALGFNDKSHYILVYYFPKESKLCYLNLNTKAFAKVNFESDKVENKFEIYHIGGRFYLFKKAAQEIYKIQYEHDFLEVQLVSDIGIIFEQKRVHDDIKNGFYFNGGAILKNFNSICITSENLLQFNIHKLNLGYNDMLLLQTDREYNSKINAVREDKKFVFPDGSEILLGKGMLTLVSSDENIPKIFLPPLLNFSLGLATEEEFAGNNYFYNDNTNLNKISTADFIRKYLEPFIQQIKNYGI